MEINQPKSETNLRHLLAAASNVVISHIIHPLLVLSFDWLTLAVDDSIGSHDAVRGWVALHHLELHGVHGLTSKGQPR